MDDAQRTAQIADILTLCDTTSPAAAVHLALPVGQYNSIHATCSGRRWWWRDHSVSFDDDSVEAVAGAAVALTAASWCDGDIGRDLTTTAGWFDAARSGTRIIVWGSLELCGVEVAGDGACPPEELCVLAGELCSSAPGDVGGVRSYGELQLLVSATPHAVLVTAAGGDR